jgi:hypothetical protein
MDILFQLRLPDAREFQKQAFFLAKLYENKFPAINSSSRPAVVFLWL